MNKQDLENLINSAEYYLGKEMEISISRKISIPNYKTFKFIEIKEIIGFSEENEEMNFKPPIGVLKSSDGIVKNKPLSEIVKYFENKTN